jgi:hypothetical protein
VHSAVLNFMGTSAGSLRPRIKLDNLLQIDHQRCLTLCVKFACISYASLANWKSLREFCVYGLCMVLHGDANQSNGRFGKLLKSKAKDDLPRD